MKCIEVGRVNNINNPSLNPLSAKFIKWSNTLKQIVGKLPTICLSVFDHFSGLAFKGLNDDKDCLLFWIKIASCLQEGGGEDEDMLCCSVTLKTFYFCLLF